VFRLVALPFITVGFWGVENAGVASSGVRGLGVDNDIRCDGLS